MNFPAEFFDTSTVILTILMSVALLMWAIRNIQWKKIDIRALNAWIGACVILVLLWSLKGGFRAGLAYHLLGGVAFTLLAGMSMALLGMAFVLIGVTLAGTLEWSAFGINYLVMAVVPVMVAHGLLKFARIYLPSNYFIYIFFNAFFAGGLSLSVAAFIGITVLAFSGAYSSDYLYGDALAFYFLLSWSEAFMTGLMIAVCVVYKPHWVATFDDNRYLPRR